MNLNFTCPYEQTRLTVVKKGLPLIRSNFLCLEFLTQVSSVVIILTFTARALRPLILEDHT